MISDEKKNLIRQRILEDCPLEMIAEEAQVSKRTVQRIKKEMPEEVYEAAKDAGDNSIKIDYSRMLTAKEQKLTEKLQGVLALYEDPEEGWVYHVTKYDAVVQMSARVWCFVAYPESAPAGWVRKLEMTMLESEISPLHDKDKWNHDSPAMVDKATGEIIPKGARYTAGDRKKAHWHGMVKFPRQTSFRQANTIIQSITHGPYVQPLKGSTRGMHEYFTHRNQPNKYQGYDPQEIVRLNGFSIEPTKRELMVMQADIIDTILREGISDWADLMRYYSNNVEYLGVITNKPGAFSATVRSMWHKQHPEGKVQRVEIVTNNNINNANKEEK